MKNERDIAGVSEFPRTLLEYSMIGSLGPCKNYLQRALEQQFLKCGRRWGLVRTLEKDDCNSASLMTQHQYVPSHMKIREVRDGEILS